MGFILRHVDVIRYGNGTAVVGYVHVFGHGRIRRNLARENRQAKVGKVIHFVDLRNRSVLENKKTGDSAIGFDRISFSKEQVVHVKYYTKPQTQCSRLVYKNKPSSGFLTNSDIFNKLISWEWRLEKGKGHRADFLSVAV